MTLEQIKQNIDAIAKVFTEQKKVDTNSMLLLSIAELLLIIAEEKDGIDDTRNKLKI